MKKSFMLGCILSASVLVVSAPAQAAEWHQGNAKLRFSNHPVEASRTFLQKHASELRIESIDLIPQRTLPLGSLHTVRYQQHHNNVPVIGKSAAIRIDAHGTIKVAVIDIARGLSVSTTPTWTASQALSQVSALIGKELSPDSTPKLVVLPFGNGRLAWHVDIFLKSGPHRFVVDAHTGDIVEQYSLSQHALGRIYEINPIQTPTLVDVPLPDLDEQDLLRLTGFGGSLKAYSYASGDINYGNLKAVQSPATEEDDFLFEPNSAFSGDDPFSEVMSYYHAARIRNFFQDTFDIDMSGDEFSLAVVANYAPQSSPEYIQNAFYTPWMAGYPTFPGQARNLICLGRGYYENIAHDSDVLLHEFTHYISNNVLDYSVDGFYDRYGYAAMQGAINEGTADYFSSTLNDEPAVGEYALGASARNLNEPVGTCPENVYGESHEDGKLIGSAGWALRKAFGPEIADQLVWGSMMLLNNTASLGDFGNGVVQTAKDLGLDDSSMNQIEAILAERGLDDCERSLDIHDHPRTSQLIGLEIIGYYLGGGCSAAKNYGIVMSSIFHFAHTPKPGDTSATFDIDLSRMGGGSLDWSLFIHRDEMGVFNPGVSILKPSFTHDYSMISNTGPKARFVIDENSDPPFDPNTTYYAVILHQNCAMSTLTIRSHGQAPEQPDAGPEPAPDAGPGLDAGLEAGDDGAQTTTPTNYSAEGGCSCDLGHRSSSVPFATALMLMGWAGLRRRNSRSRN